MAVKTLSKTERFGILKQTTWGTAEVASSAFRLCQWINAGTPNPNPDVQVDQFNVTSGYGTHFEKERFFVDGTSGLPTIPFSGTCEKATMTPFLVGAYQPADGFEASSTPYLKTIPCGGLLAPIDFAAGVGNVHTIALDQGGSDDDGILLTDAVIQNLSIVWDLNARGVARLVNMSGAWVGSLLQYEQSLSGDWENATIAQTGFFNNTDAWDTDSLTIGGVDYKAECVRRVEEQVNNNVTSNCKTTAGRANQYDMAPEYKTILTLDYNATTEKILKDFQAGDSAVSLAWSNDASGTYADGKWSFLHATTGGVLISPPKIYQGDFLGIQLEIRWMSALGATPLNVMYTDTVDWAYN